MVSRLHGLQEKLKYAFSKVRFTLVASSVANPMQRATDLVQIQMVAMQQQRATALCSVAWAQIEYILWVAQFTY